MKSAWFILVFGAVVCAGTLRLAAQESKPTGQASDEAAIRDNCAKYVEAYNRRDSGTMASMWSPEAVYEDPHTGERVTGRDAIKKQLDDAMAGDEDAKLSVNIDSIEFVSPNVAIEKGTAEVTSGNGEPEDSVYSAVHVKRDGKWQIDRISEWDAPTPPPSNYEHLKELAWMVGSWVDQDSTATVQTDCDWAKNRNFLTRSFAVTVGDQVSRAGMQIVGWDPVAKQIRSWVFDSDGGFGQGSWTHKGNQWIVQSTGTLADGGKTSAVNIYTKVDDDSFTWQSTNREADGHILPNIDPVVVVRKPTE